MVAKTYGVSEKKIEVLDATSVDRRALKEGTAYLQVCKHHLRPFFGRPTLTLKCRSLI